MKNWKYFVLMIVILGCKNSVKNLETIAEGLDNSYERAQKIEEYQLKKYSDKVQRKDSSLVLKLENNNELVLKDNGTGDGVELFSFREYYDLVKVFVIEVQYYEGGSYLLVNGKNGEKLNIFGKTKLSPDMKKIVSYNMDIFAGFSDNGFQIIDLQDNHFKIEYEYKPDNWGPENINWISNSEIEIEKYGFNKDGNAQNIGKTYFVLNENWIEKK